MKQTTFPFSDYFKFVFICWMLLTVFQPKRHSVCWQIVAWFQIVNFLARKKFRGLNVRFFWTEMSNSHFILRQIDVWKELKLVTFRRHLMHQNKNRIKFWQNRIEIITSIFRVDRFERIYLQPKLNHYYHRFIKMPFMKGSAPIRRTKIYLERGQLFLNNSLKILSINYNAEGEHHQGAR